MLDRLIVGHFVGDFLIQNDWMAGNKKKRSFPCLIHCLLYTTSIFLASLCTLPWWAVLVVFATHFAQDRTQFVPWYMQKIGQQYFAREMAPWSAIIVDNSMHLLVLWCITVVIDLQLL